MPGLGNIPRNTSEDPRIRRAISRLRTEFLVTVGNLELDDDGRAKLADLAGFDTDDISEGTNQFYTDERVDDRVAALIQDGTGISWTYDDPNDTLTANLQAAVAGTIGGVLEASARADSAQDAVTLTSVSTTVTDPADAPVDADALRDDLVANALAEIETALGNLSTRDTELETAIETLAGEFNDLLAKLRSSGALAT